jgi:DNA-binding HxlR family transcriptional regulator
MRPGKRSAVALDSAEPARRLTAAYLADRHPGTTARWWRERLPELVEAGIITRHLRWYFGRPSAVERWLAGEAEGQPPQRPGRAPAPGKRAAERVQ